MKPRNPGGINTGNILQSTTCAVPLSEFKRVCEIPGITLVEIAAACKCSVSSAFQWMAELSITKTRGRQCKSRFDCLSDNDLCDKYLLDNQSAKKIGQAFGVPVTSVTRRLRSLGVPLRNHNDRLSLCGLVLNPDGINTGNILERTGCPVSLAKLEHLYYVEIKSVIEIAVFAGDVAEQGKPFDEDVVRKWLDLAGIKIRDLSTRQRIAYKSGKFSHLRNPPKEWICTEKRSAASSRNIKIARRVFQHNAASRRVKLLCSNIHCSRGDNWSRKWFFRSPSAVKPRANYCCNECKIIGAKALARDIGSDRRLRKLTLVPVPYTVPDHLRELAESIGVEP